VESEVQESVPVPGSVLALKASWEQNGLLDSSQHAALAAALLRERVQMKLHWAVEGAMDSALRVSDLNAPSVEGIGARIAEVQDRNQADVHWNRVAVGDHRLVVDRRGVRPSANEMK
jgi:hypothetical protein